MAIAVFIFQFVDGHLSFHVLAIRTNAAVHIRVREFLCEHLFSSFGLYRSGIAELCADSVFNILKNGQISQNYLTVLLCSH